jgi:LysM repeat protein
MRRNRLRQQGNWFVPGVVATGLMTLVAWQMDWIPLRMARTETGTLLNEIESTDSDGIAIGFQPDLSQPDTPPQFAAQLDEFGPTPESELDVQDSNPFEDAIDLTQIPEQREPTTNNAPSPFAAPTHNNAGNVEPAHVDEFHDAPSQHAEFSASEPAHVGFSKDGTNDGTIEPQPFSESQATAIPIPTADIEQRIAKIDRLLGENDYLTAHSELSKIYWRQPEYRPLIMERIEETARSIYASPQPHFVKPYIVQHGDQLRKIAERYKVPWKYLASLNRVDERKIREGQKLKVNKGPFSALVDLSDFELTIHAHGFFVHRYPVGIGKKDSSPQGRFTVQQKLVNPTYYGPDGLVIDGDDPSNPLGEHWIDLGDSYGIHGTIDPESVGQARSRGCIRMQNEDIAEVFSLLSEGSEIVIRR